MKKQISHIVIAATLALSPLVFGTGCSVMHGKQSVGAYSSDKVLRSRIKTALYADPLVAGTAIKVQALNGVVELSGFVDSEEAKRRAAEVAASTPGVSKVYNNLILPTGR